MASGVIKVEIDTQQYNTSNFYCGFARDFEDSRSKLWSDFCVELTTFNFIWGSLEALIEEITNATEEDSKPTYGKKYLKENYTKRPIEKYDCVLKALKLLIKHSSFPNKDKILSKTVLQEK
jgi:hypothetical protein